MISLVIHVDSLGNQFHDLRWNRSLHERISMYLVDYGNCTHLIICRMVLADQFLYLRGRQNPADIEQNVDISGRGLRVRALAIDLLDLFSNSCLFQLKKLGRLHQAFQLN